MIRSLTIIAAALALTACAGQPKPLIVTKTNYVPVTVSPDLLNLDSCPWPEATVFIPTNKESEVIDYILEGYKAWTCENDTRGTIKTQVERQKAEIEARNEDAKKKAAEPAKKEKKPFFSFDSGKKEAKATPPAGSSAAEAPVVLDIPTAPMAVPAVEPAEARLLEAEVPTN